MRPALSIMTPVYNGEAFLPRCRRTLEGQTVTDWEWILVDDGSTDDTPRILDRFAAADERVRIVRSPVHRGCGHARTLAVERARAPWLVVWDVDDLYFPWRLERVLDAARRRFDFFCSYVVVADPEGNILGVRGFLTPFRTERILTFTHPSLACRTEIARSIGYCPDLRSVGQVGEDKKLILTLASRHHGLYHRAPLVVHQPSRNYLRRSLDGNTVALRTVRELYRARTLPLSSGGYLRAQAATIAKLGFLHLLRPFPGLYPHLMRARLLGPPAREYVLDEREQAFVDGCFQRSTPLTRGSPAAT